jgi:hypothetical protein
LRGQRRAFQRKVDPFAEYRLDESGGVSNQCNGPAFEDIELVAHGDRVAAILYPVSTAQRRVTIQECIQVLT